MTRKAYFDNAATTPIDPRVREAMLPYLDDGFGNANSIHDPGRRARAAVERAREQLASLLDIEDPSQLAFTSGATESNNWVISAFPSGAISPFEHSAVREPAIYRGYLTLPNQELHIGGPGQRVPLLSVMSVNNEIGSQWNAADFRDQADFVHSDVTQGVGKLPTNLDGIDFASLSGHKFYGPKGIGALYAADAFPEPLLRGGEQEQKRRAGTLNVAGIVGMGAAAAIAQEEMEMDLEQTNRLRTALLDSLRVLSDWRINGGDSASPYILSLSFYGVEGETLVVEADHAGFAISSGAACSSESTEPSHVLEALGMTEPWRRGTVRISFGRFNDEESTCALAKSLLRSVENLRTMT